MTAVLAPLYWRGLAEVPRSWGRSVVTLGVFDGLHRGHVRLLSRAVELGRRLGARHGFDTHGVALLPGCSSTQVRRLLAAGDVAGAARVLGRPHQVDGRAVDGRIIIRASATLPAPGTYEVLVGGSAALALVADGDVWITGAQGDVVVQFLDTGPEASTPSPTAGGGSGPT